MSAMVCKRCGVVKISRHYGVAMDLRHIGSCFSFVADNFFDALEVTEKVEPFLTELGSVSNRTTQSSP